MKRKNIADKIRLSKYVIKFLENIGMKQVARQVYMWMRPDERQITVRKTTATFDQTSYADYVEINRAHDETPIMKKIIKSIDESTVFYDIGANIGFYTIFAAQIITSGRVIAFEPNPYTAHRLEANLSRNNQSATILNMALSDATGTTALRTPELHGQAQLTTTEDAPSQSVSVEQYQGDKVIEEHDLPIPTVIKIDVEGHEAHVLRGLAETIEDPACKTITCELHPEMLTEYGDTPEEVKLLLRDSGFEIDEIGINSPRPNIWAKKKQ